MQFKIIISKRGKERLIYKKDIYFMVMVVKKITYIGDVKNGIFVALVFTLIARRLKLLNLMRITLNIVVMQHLTKKIKKKHKYHIRRFTVT